MTVADRTKRQSSLLSRHAALLTSPLWGTLGADRSDPVCSRDTPM